MGRSNLSARGYASAYNSMITNRYEGGGNAKAGLGMGIGRGNPFIYAAIVHGAAGHPAPTVSGARQGMVYFRVTGKQYPISCVNQLSGVGMPRRGMWNASADGVNKAKCEEMQRRHHPDTLNACGGGCRDPQQPTVYYSTNCTLSSLNGSPVCDCQHNVGGGSQWYTQYCTSG